MKNCLLCKKRPADKKGSHIVPHFLLKRIENIDGKTGRDYELGFIIQEFDTTSYIGRSVPVDEIDKVFGELTDEEIAKNRHPLVVDNFFCSRCEERFAKIESKYAGTLQRKGTEIYSSGVSSELGLLFWSSVIWRVSINEKNEVKLSKNQNEKLRRILDSNLKKDTNPDYSELKSSNEVKRISYRVLRCPNYSDTHTTYMLWHPKFKHPYSLILDEYVLLFAFKDNYNDYQRMDLFGIQQEALDAPINKFNDEEKILPLSEQTMSAVNYSVIEEVMKVRVKRLDELLDGVHQRLGGRGKVMPAHIKQEIFEEITSDEKKLGRKHNLEDITKSAYKVLKKYTP